MAYSKYIIALVFVCFTLFVSAQTHIRVGTGAEMKISCGTRVMVGTTRLIPTDTLTYATNDTISLAAVPAGLPLTDSVGTGNVIFAAGCGTGFRQSADANLSSWNVSLYPNPAANELFIDTKGFSGKTDLLLLDMSGRTILTQSWEAEGDEVRSLNLKSLSSGLYLYRITNGTKVASGKMIKE